MTEANTRKTAVEITQAFLAAVFSGDGATAAALTAPDAVFVSTNPRANPANPLHGTFIGTAGARAFFGGFADLLDPGAFEVSAAFGEDDRAALHGTLAHKVRATGKPFVSDWALVTRIDAAGRIALYHFYEDTEALAEAMR